MPSPLQNRSWAPIVPSRERQWHHRSLGPVCCRELHPAGKGYFHGSEPFGKPPGVGWLERTLRGLVDESIRVHPMSLGYDHVDVTLVPLRPGVILIDPVKVRRGRSLSNSATGTKWSSRRSCRRALTSCLTRAPPTMASAAMSWPFMRIRRSGRNSAAAHQALEKRKFNVIPLQYRHGRTFGGSCHCITLDTSRDGDLADYFS